MKIRSDFVTNSSSSSFILLFDEKPTSVKKLERKMFDCPGVKEYFGNTMTTKDIARCVLEDVRFAEKHDDGDIWEKIAREMESLVYLKSFLKEKRLGGPAEGGLSDAIFSGLEIPDSYEVLFKARVGKSIWNWHWDEDISERETNRLRRVEVECHEEANKAIQEVAAKATKRLRRKAKGKYPALLTYCDEGGGWECVMEHGDVFRGIPHIRVSHH